MKIECLNGPVCAEENNTRTLTLTVDAAFSGYEIRLGLLTPAGRHCLTPEIALSNGVGTFALPASVLDAPGLLLAQIIAENGAGQVAKSEIFAFPVERSIPVGAARQTSDGLITLGALHNAVAALEAFAEGLPPAAKSGSYTDLTDCPAIPTVPANVSAFVNDAGYLTAHQSLAGYATLAAVNEAVAAAALDANGIAVDGSFTANSQNPVESRVIQSALEGKSDTGHTHDDRYYTDTEVDALLAALPAVPAVPGQAKGVFTAESGFTAGYAYARQIGSVVFVSIFGTLAAAIPDADPILLGTFGGVDKTPLGGQTLGPCLTDDASMENAHSAAVMLEAGNSGLRVYLCPGADSAGDTKVSVCTFYVTNDNNA